MQKNYIISFTLVLVFAGCKKPLRQVEEYFPEVKTQSVVPTEDGGLRVDGEIISPGNTKIKYVGFCMDTVPSPAMTSNQIIVGTSEDFFQAVYSEGIVAGKTYYFRSWACNENGYTLGNIVAVTAGQTVTVTAPCTPVLNTSAIGLFGSNSGSLLSVYHLDGSNGQVMVDVTGSNSNAGNLDLLFGSRLRTKVFTTTRNYPAANEVSIEMDSFMSSGVVKEGQKVYVNEIAAGQFEITLCDLEWEDDETAETYRVTARFRSPL